MEVHKELGNGFLEAVYRKFLNINGLFLIFNPQISQITRITLITLRVMRNIQGLILSSLPRGVSC